MATYNIKNHQINQYLNKYEWKFLNITSKNIYTWKIIIENISSELAYNITLRGKSSFKPLGDKVCRVKMQ